MTYALGFERSLRGATAGDRVFSLIGAGSGVVGIIAAHGAPNALAGAITGIGFIGGGLVFRQAGGRTHMVLGLNTAAAIFAAGAATLMALFVLEIRHVRVLNMLDGRRWAERFRDDEEPPRDRVRHEPDGPGASADP